MAVDEQPGGAQITALVELVELAQAEMADEVETAAAATVVEVQGAAEVVLLAGSHLLEVEVETPLEATPLTTKGITAPVLAVLAALGAVAQDGSGEVLRFRPHSELQLQLSGNLTCH
jgi:hypothetical protein